MYIRYEGSPRWGEGTRAALVASLQVILGGRLPGLHSVLYPIFCRASVFVYELLSDSPKKGDSDVDLSCHLLFRISAVQLTHSVKNCGCSPTFGSLNQTF